MTEVKGPDGPLIPMENQTEVKGSWFEAYKKGNNIWPNADYPVLNVLILNAALSDPPASWQEFSQSKFSDVQLNEIGEGMSKLHSAYQVNRGYASLLPDKKPKLNSGEIFNHNIENVWQRMKTNAIYYLAKKAGMRFYPEAPNVELAGAHVDSFFKNNSEELGKIKSTVSSAASAIETPEFKNLGALYRLLLVKRFGHDKEGRVESAKELRQEMSKLYAEEIPNDDPGDFLVHHSRANAEKLARVLIAKKVKEVEPDFDVHDGLINSILGNITTEPAGETFQVANLSNQE